MSLDPGAFNVLKGETTVHISSHAAANATDSDKGHVGWFRALDSSNRVLLRPRDEYLLEWHISLHPDAKWYSKTSDQLMDINLFLSFSNLELHLGIHCRRIIMYVL